MRSIAVILFYVAAALMLLDGLAYSLGAVRPIRAAVKAPSTYWDRRLLLNLLLANAGLYFTGLFALVGAALSRGTPGAARAVLVLSAAVCLYSLVSVLLFTPRDWAHTLPRTVAAVLIVVGLLIPS